MNRIVCARFLPLRWMSTEIPPPSRNEWWGRDAGSPVSTARAAPAFGSQIDYTQLKKDRQAEIQNLVEVRQMKIFREQLLAGKCDASKSAIHPEELARIGLDRVGVINLLKASLATSCLHLESRIAAFLGQGFYTIGPAGEELMACIGLLLRGTDSMALHYRHLAAQIARQIHFGKKSLECILLDRARGHCVSIQDPVTAGAHCAIGGGPYDFIVTSTLASQAPPAVGRALGSFLAHQISGANSLFPKDFVSFVSLGDGSANHSHFLTALNMTEYAEYRNFKCPVVFAISDNNLSISLRGYKWLLNGFLKKVQLPIFRCDGTDVMSVLNSTHAAIEYSRVRQRPSMLVYTDLPRRFGHAATDRQSMYLTSQEIDELSSTNPLSSTCSTFVEAGLMSYPEILELLDKISELTESAFEIAVNEPKISSREEIKSRNCVPLMPVPRYLKQVSSKREETSSSKGLVMRKHMTQIYEEILENHPDTVYIGEDVRHGGYYAVTEGLASKSPLRVQDFPPEETFLIGAAMGYAQTGLVPIVEIPYAKYLDCGADMYFEAAIMNWLSNSKQPNGMLIRLQGFDRGVFGGNFHTHNALHIPPGIDVVCYSNGPDYARGIRYAIQQAKAGRVVMTVDSTNLLNLRHLHEDKDCGWQFPYASRDEILHWDQVQMYGADADCAIVTYGNGVVTSLQAVHFLSKEMTSNPAVVIDCPYLSSIPEMLRKVLKNFERVVFVDVCKQGMSPLSNFVTTLQSEDNLPRHWQHIAAQSTYNPLGSTLTFTSTEDVIEAYKKIIK